MSKCFTVFRLILHLVMVFVCYEVKRSSEKKTQCNKIQVTSQTSEIEMNCAELKIQSVEFKKENECTLKPSLIEYNEAEEKVVFKFPKEIPKGYTC